MQSYNFGCNYLILILLLQLSVTGNNSTDLLTNHYIVKPCISSNFNTLSIVFSVLIDNHRQIIIDAQWYGLSGSFIICKEDWCSFPNMGWPWRAFSGLMVSFTSNDLDTAMFPLKWVFHNLMLTFFFL
jgi:hypothetical protein